MSVTPLYMTTSTGPTTRTTSTTVSGNWYTTATVPTGTGYATYGNAHRYAKPVDPMDQEDDMLPTGPEMLARIRQLEAELDVLQAERKLHIEHIDRLSEQNRRISDQVREIKQRPDGEVWRKERLEWERLVYTDEPYLIQTGQLVPYAGDSTTLMYKLKNPGVQPMICGTVVQDTTDPNNPKVHLLSKDALKAKS